MGNEIKINNVRYLIGKVQQIVRSNTKRNNYLKKVDKSCQWGRSQSEKDLYGNLKNVNKQSGKPASKETEILVPYHSNTKIMPTGV